MKYLYLFILILLLSPCYAQTQKIIYITNTGQYSIDPKTAADYILITKLSDSGYMAKEYDMRDTIVMSGFYKDSTISIPNGKFLYYYKLRIDNSKEAQNKMAHLKTMGAHFFSMADHVDTNNFIQTVGYFLNGKREGIWLTYLSKGVRLSERTYENNKINGPCKDYLPQSGSWNEYTMSNNLYNGKYLEFNKDSLLLSETDYINGKQVDKIDHFLPAKEPDNFEKFLNKKLAHYYTPLTQQPPVVRYTISKTGRITNPIIIRGINTEIDSAIISALLIAPLYNPATYDSLPKEQIIENPLVLFGYLRNTSYYNSLPNSTRSISVSRSSGPYVIMNTGALIH